MVEEIFKTERHTKPLNAPAKKPFLCGWAAHYIIFFIKNQVKALEIDIFYYF